MHGSELTSQPVEPDVVEAEDSGEPATLATALAAFDKRADESNELDEDLYFDEPMPQLSAARVLRRFGVLDLLEERGFNPDEVTRAEMILEEHITDEEVLSVPTEILAADVVAMLPGSEVEAEFDEEGFGHAWIETQIRFRDALASVTRWSLAAVRPTYRPRCSARRAPRARRVRTSRSARGAPGRLSADDEPHDDDVGEIVRRCREVAAATGLAWIHDLVREEVERLAQRCAP